MKNELHLRQIIADSFSSYTEQVALLNHEGSQFSYAQLKSEVASHADFLFRYVAGGLIGVYSEKNIHAPVFVYSVLWASKAYLPIDYRSPVERILQILHTAKPAAVVVQEKFLAAFTNAIHDQKIQFSSKPINNEYTLIIFENPKVYSADLAYILFTSGSTGVPKGIMHTHQSAFAFLQWCGETFNSECKRFVSIAPFQFDLSVFDLFYPLMLGGSLLLPNDFSLGNSRMMAELIEDYKIETIYSTPSFFNWFLTTGRPERRNFSDTKQLLIAGETLHWILLHELKKNFVNSEYYNLYGPTETNVCTYYKVNFSDERLYKTAVPIGKPCSNCQILLLHGVTGQELHVTGSNLMLGYASIDKSPFTLLNGNHFYNTGDVVEYVFEENLVYISRADRMIKKNGFRIEPSEVEACLKKLAGIKDAVAIAKRDTESTQLLAFVVAEIEYDMLTLRNHCAEKIPYYMIPDLFIFVDNIPLNANHKTDTAALLKHIT